MKYLIFIALIAMAYIFAYLVGSFVNKHPSSTDDVLPDEEPPTHI